MRSPFPKQEPIPSDKQAFVNQIVDEAFKTACFTPDKLYCLSNSQWLEATEGSSQGEQYLNETWELLRKRVRWLEPVHKWETVMDYVRRFEGRRAGLNVPGDDLPLHEWVLMHEAENQWSESCQPLTPQLMSGESLRNPAMTPEEFFQNWTIKKPVVRLNHERVREIKCWQDLKRESGDDGSTAAMSIYLVGAIATGWMATESPGAGIGTVAFIILLIKNLAAGADAGVIKKAEEDFDYAFKWWLNGALFVEFVEPRPAKG